MFVLLNLILPVVQSTSPFRRAKTPLLLPPAFTVRLYRFPTPGDPHFSTLARDRYTPDIISDPRSIVYDHTIQSDDLGLLNLGFVGKRGKAFPKPQQISPAERPYGDPSPINISRFLSSKIGPSSSRPNCLAKCVV